ncbi:MAG: tRNA-dependent cyclodipeptide synthase [Planctomycetes bacterium]|nr:tRNA-dependent cyclodipeptide synthase [Planctomycetota bacterium]
MSDSNSDKQNLPAVRIVTITPEISEQELFSHRRCYMGISLDNPVFEGRSLQALLNWATERFDHCLVVTGDYLRRHNELILNGLDDERAVAMALASGDEFIEKTRHIFTGMDGDKIELIRWRDCLAFVEYQHSRAALDKLFAANEAFRKAVGKDAVGFVERQKDRNRSLAVDENRAIEISCEYLLEEIAVFSALSERGWNVELYPGPELHVLAAVAAGRFGDITPGLKDRINVELGCGADKARTQ